MTCKTVAELISADMKCVEDEAPAPNVQCSFIINIVAENSIESTARSEHVDADFVNSFLFFVSHVFIFSLGMQTSTVWCWSGRPVNEQ